MPHLEKRIWQAFKTKEFRLIGVDRKESREKVKRFSETMKISYPLVLDTEDEIYTLYAHPNSGVTRNVLIDKSGKIIFLTRSFNEDEFNELIQKISDEITN
jgi:peroxiredoxin